MGFTEEEVTQIAKDTNEEQALPALKKWYDGYRFGNIDIYNPWSIINFFAERTADDYWVNTSSNDIIQHMMQGNAKSQEKNLLTLLHGRTVAAIIREGLIYKDITQNKDGLYTLLLMTGYLTAVQNTTVPNGRLCQLKIPNEELTHVFQSEVLNLEPFSKSKSNSGQHQGIFLYKAQQHFFARLLRLSLHFSARLFVKSHYQGVHRQNFNLSDRLKRPALL